MNNIFSNGLLKYIQRQNHLFILTKSSPAQHYVYSIPSYICMYCRICNLYRSQNYTYIPFHKSRIISQTFPVYADIICNAFRLLMKTQEPEGFTYV